METELEQIYIKHFKQVYSFLLYLSHDKDLAEELTQETFFIAVKNIKKFRNECKIDVWLCQIAKNLFYKQVKKDLKERKLSLQEIEKLSFEDYMEENLQNQIEKKFLYKCINKLDKLSKKIIILRIFYNLSFKEISNILGNKSENYVRVIFYRIKEKLKEEINNEKGFKM